MVGLWLVAVVAAIQFSALPGWGRPLVQLGLGLAIGGAAGNLVDTMRRRPIVDFIDLGWWPVFNLADCAIVVGLLLALVSLITHA